MVKKHKPKVSLIMIVKNEEGGIRRAVSSVKGLADEVIIGVDSASTDGTLEIAKEIADVCYEFEWTGSFCDARNTYLGKASGDWVFTLDGHEYVKSFSPIDWDKTAETADSIRVSIRMEDGTIIQADRIFKNGIKYISDVHNFPDIKKTVTDSQFLIIHDRYVQTQEVLRAREKQRDEMIMKNMGKKRDMRCLYYAGRQHLDMKRFDEAIKVYREYLEKFKKQKKTKDRIAEKRRVLHGLAKAYFLSDRLKQAVRVLKENLKENAFLKGQMYAAKGDHPEAVKQFMIAHTLKPTGDGFMPVAELDFDLWDHLSVSLFHVGQFEMAYTATQKALELKDDEQVKSNARVYAHSFRAAKEKGAEYYDRLFKDGYDTSRYNDIYELIVRMLEDTEDPRVLEAGCGVGSLGKMIIDKGYPYVGFDFSKEAVRHARKLAGNKYFHIGDAYDSKEYEGDYNVVVATELLEHVDDLKVLSKIKSGTKIIASVPTFGDVAHLRVYQDKQRDIVDKFSKYVIVNNVMFSEELGIYVFEGIIK